MSFSSSLGYNCWCSDEHCAQVPARQRELQFAHGAVMTGLALVFDSCLGSVFQGFTFIFQHKCRNVQP